ncbi:hypothetical protein Vi05172_g9282 [Venturia inaequalis]|nr:hypothetical protein Vi05172_g9282 [Venturia inaequalis]
MLPPPPPTKQPCLLCGDKRPTPQLVLLPCKTHWACRKPCFPSFFENAIRNQSLHPPRCCKAEIAVKDYDLVLPAALVDRYRRKTEEYRTDPRLRRFCAKEGCGTFLAPGGYVDVGPGREVTVAGCRVCKGWTCVVCTRLVLREEYGHECLAPALFETNREYTTEARFKACPFCGRNGVLEQACNHIICACNGEWCFICLEPWVGGETHKGCLRYGDPVYDAGGFDEKGFHRDSGFDRDGFTRAGYNIRGLNREGERVEGFAERKVGGGVMTTGREREWGREMRREFEARGVDGLGRFVEHLFAAVEARGDPVNFEQFHAFVVTWLREQGIRLVGVNAVVGDVGVPQL